MAATASSLTSASSLPSWDADLDLNFSYRHKKTALTKKQHRGPLLVQRPFYPEDKKCCHVYVIHPPGGIVGGDTLNIRSQLENHTHALITTPAATKFYKSNGQCAKQLQIIDVNENAILEWLPQETVFFNSTNAETVTRININQTSKIITWEIQCYGFPANKLPFTDGYCVQKLEVWQDNMPLFLECNRVDSNSKLINAHWGLQAHQAIGTMLFTDTEYAELITLLQEPAYESMVVASTQVHGFIVVRALATYAEQIKDLFIAIWKLIRPSLLSIDPCPPRIWNT